MNHFLKDVTFIIPVRMDSIIRLENLLVVIKCIKKFNSKIIILESGKYKSFTKRLFPQKYEIEYRFVNDDDIVFYRTRFINMALEFVDTPYVAVWDADVIVDDKQIVESMTILRSGDADVSFPYDGDFLNTDIPMRDLFLEKQDIRFLYRYKNYMNSLYGENFIGGGFIINKEKYINAGKENENYYGWGPEDLDRVQRWKAMEYKIHRSQGPMFHLCHPRDINGIPRSTTHSDLCMLQLADSRYSSKYEIKQNY